MTKDEMLKECFADNYTIIQHQIKEAMKNGNAIYMLVLKVLMDLNLIIYAHIKLEIN